MRIGLIDVDSHNYPNLCLMKLSAWYKQAGCEVDLLKPADVLNGQNLFYEYDKLIGACVFDWNMSTVGKLQEMGVYVGGTGTHTKVVLQDYVERIMPDYSLSYYGELNKYLMDHAGVMTNYEYNRYYDAVMKVTKGIMDMVLLRRELEKRESHTCDT